MRNFRLGAVMAMWLAGLGVAHAQSIAHSGWEAGGDVYVGRSGENALFLGGFDHNQMIGFRMSLLDEQETVPCSAGVGYEYAAHRTSGAAIVPTLGASVSHIFSCASESDVARSASPAVHNSAILTAGIRVRVITATRVGASLKILGFVGQRFGQSAASDVRTRGVAVGLALHTP